MAEPTTQTALAENGTATGPQQSLQQETQPSQNARQASGQDISALVTRESRKTVEKLLQEAGITPGDDPNARLKDYKKWLDDQKSTLEKAQGDVATLTSTLAGERAKSLQLERRFAAMGKGVPADRADAYVRLADGYLGEDDDYNKALDAALKDFPLTAAQQTEKRGSAGVGANPPPNNAGQQEQPLGALLAQQHRDRYKRYQKKGD